MPESIEKEILFVSHKYPPATGGMEKQSFELIKGCSKYTKVHSLLYEKGKQSLLAFFINLNSNILKLLKQHPAIQVIHFNDGLIASLASYHKGYRDIPKVITLHGLDVVFPLPYFQNKILPRFNQFEKIITVSQATAQAALERGIDPGKLLIIKNGVDHQLACPLNATMEDLYLRYPKLQPGKKTLITIGRAVKRKGFSWLLKEVVPHLSDEYQLLMIGPYEHKINRLEKLIRLLPKKLQRLLVLFLGFPSDQQEIRHLLQSEHVSNRVQHLGKIPFADLQILLANSTAFLMPNIRQQGDMEGFGLVCLEASLSGTLVLAANIDGITDAVQHQKNGILLPSESPQEWIKQLQDILLRPGDYKEKAQTYKTFTQQEYGWDKMVRQYMTVFKNM